MCGVIFLFTNSEDLRRMLLCNSLLMLLLCHKPRLFILARVRPRHEKLWTVNLLCEVNQEERRTCLVDNLSKSYNYIFVVHVNPEQIRFIRGKNVFLKEHSVAKNKTIFCLQADVVSMSRLSLHHVENNSACQDAFAAVSLLYTLTLSRTIIKMGAKVILLMFPILTTTQARSEQRTKK